jgi:hypothetical protein
MATNIPFQDPILVERPKTTNYYKPLPGQDKTGQVPKAKLSSEWQSKLGTHERRLVDFLIKSSLYANANGTKIISPFFCATSTYFQEFAVSANQWFNPQKYIRESINSQMAHTISRANFNFGMLKEKIDVLSLMSTDKIKELHSMTEYGEFAYKFDQDIKDLPEDERKDKEQKRKKQMERLLQKQTQDLSELYKESGNAVPDNIEELLKQLMGGSGEGDGDGDPMAEAKAEAEAAAEPSAPPPAPKVETPLEELLRRLGEAVRYLNKGDGPKDVVSNATFKYGGRMIKAGIPVDAIMHAFALTWPQHAREELEIAPYDVSTFGESLDNQHYAVPYVEAMVNAGIPVMLVGPTQAGKGYLTKNIAENRKVQYGSVPLSAGTSISWLFGRNMPKGFVSTDLIRCYQDGGVFLFDEMDAADSNLLLGVNDALSNNELSNPVVDERIVKHADFIPLAAANTWGLGADADYTGRERLDMATLERWRIGRVEINYDRNLQKRIAEDESGELLRENSEISN